MVMCTFPDCGRDATCKGLCHTHYEQQRKGRELRPIGKRGQVDPELRRAISSLGGAAAQRKGTAYRWDAAAAARAGVRGGLIRSARRYGWSAEKLSAALTQRGLDA